MHKNFEYRSPKFSRVYTSNHDLFQKDLGLSGLPSSFVKLGLPFPNIDRLQSEPYQAWIKRSCLRIVNFSWTVFYAPAFRISLFVEDFKHSYIPIVRQQYSHTRVNSVNHNCWKLCNSNNCFNYLPACLTFSYSIAVASNFMPFAQCTLEQWTNFQCIHVIEVSLLRPKFHY